MNHYAELQAAKHCLEQMRQAILHLHNRMNFGGGIHVVDVIQRLEEIAAIGEDNPIQIPPEYRDETDEAVRDAPPDNLCDHCKNYEQECLNAGNKAVTDPADCAFYAPPDAPLCQHCKTPLPDHYVAVYSNANDCTKYCSEECAVAAGASGLLERPNGDAPPDAPTCHNTTCRCYDTYADNNCGARDEFGELVTISECHDAILSPLDAPCDHHFVYGEAARMHYCEKCGAKWEDCPEDHSADCLCWSCRKRKDTPSDAPPEDAPMRPVELDNSYSQRNNHYHCLNSHADAIVKIQRELEVGRANDRYFNEKLDYIGEMKEEIQQHIDTEFDAADKTYENREENRIQIKRLKQQINSHTAIVHGEIERRLTEMGQKIEKLEQRISGEKGE